jgi:hypothetical protein
MYDIQILKIYIIKEQSIIDTEVVVMDETIPGTSNNVKEFFIQNSVEYCECILW